ncbi:MAG: hypothetical protein ACRDGO_03620 [Actinomycetota bacterium]
MVIGAIVLVVATAVSTFVVLDHRRSEAIPFDGELVTVVVSTEDISANQPLDPLVEEGVFAEISIPQDVLVAGAVTDLLQVEGSMTATPILANEQISTARLTVDCCVDYAPLMLVYPFDEREKVLLSLLLEGERIGRIADVLGFSKERVRGIVRSVDVALDDR